METTVTALVAILGRIIWTVLGMWLVARFGFVMRLWALYCALFVLTMFVVLLLVSVEDLDPLWLALPVVAALATYIVWLPAWPVVRVVLGRMGVRARW